FNSKLKELDKLSNSEIMSKLQPQDLIKYGLIPEFVGRLPIAVGLDELDEKALVRILTEPKNALIKQYGKLLNIDGVKLHFEQEAVKLIAKQAIELGTGARGLRTIIEKSMLDTMFNVPSDKTIDKIVVKAVNGKLKYEISHKAIA
ncbi:MAG: ATP-dependent Clp protease ATP-binding subunit ClpX, partial [Clostridia bacterium]|nr:ATP-dependent Clp protease ATP-binding subunit ClpX [Clostridia bacterium]